MGEAKQRARREAAQRARFDFVDFARVAAAVRTHMTLAGVGSSSNALAHANLARHLLRRAELASEVVVGFAAWRVGPGVADVVAYGGGRDPAADAERSREDDSPHHVWLETGGHVFDVATYQLARKAAEFDQQHGKSTSVTWCPDFVLAPKASLASFARVRQEVVGLMYYERDAYLQAVVGTSAGELDSHQVECLERIYRDLAIERGGDA